MGARPQIMGARPHSERAPKNNGGAPSSCGRFGDFLLFLHAAKSWWFLDPLAVIQRCYTNSVQWKYAIGPKNPRFNWMKVTLRSRQTAYIHSTELVWPRTFMELVSVYCTLYTVPVQCTVAFIWLAHFYGFLYIAIQEILKILYIRTQPCMTYDLQNRDHLVQRRQILKSTKVTLRSWYDRVKNWLYRVKKISIKWLWPVKVTLKVIKRRLEVFC